MTSEVMEKIKQVVALSLELSNNTYEVSSEIELPVAFVWFNGHVGDIDINLFGNGWGKGKMTHRYNITYKHDHYGEKYSTNQLDEIIAEMNRLCEIRYKLENPEV